MGHRLGIAATALAAACLLALPAGGLAASVAACGVAPPHHVRCFALMRSSHGRRLVVTERHLRWLARRAHRGHARGVGADTTPGELPPGYSPATLHSAYNLPLTASGTPPTIAVVDVYDDPAAEADLQIYDQMFGLPDCTTANGCFRKLNEQGVQGSYPAPDAGWAGEISLDVEIAHAICQNCKIVLVEASTTSVSDLGVAENTAATAGATILSNSLGTDEFSSDPAAFNQPGKVVIAAAGDDGYGAAWPASSPHVVAVGGTSLIADGSGAYQSETAWSDGGSGCSAFFSAPPWQTAATGFAATGCGTHRAMADVAAVGNPQTGVAIYDSVPYGGSPGGWVIVGGTSLSAPVVAGVYGLVGGAHGINYPAATLYAHQHDAPASLRDVVGGTNGSCTAVSICTAVAGFDGPTGLGTPNGVAAFVPVAGQSTSPTGGGSATPTTTQTPPPTTTTTAPPPPPPAGTTTTTTASGYSPAALQTIAEHSQEAADAAAKAKAVAAAKAKVAAAARAKAKAKAKARARARARARRPRPSQGARSRSQGSRQEARYVARQALNASRSAASASGGTSEVVRRPACSCSSRSCWMYAVQPSHEATWASKRRCSERLSAPSR